MESTSAETGGIGVISVPVQVSNVDGPVASLGLVRVTRGGN